MGRLMDALERLGVAEDTMVIYTTDHGDFCGGHGMMDKHYAGYDDIMRVPLVMRYPGEVDGGRECGDCVSHSIDLASTILAAAGVKVPEAFEGQNLLDLVGGNIGSPRQDIFSMYQGCQMGLWSLRMIRDERYKLVYHATGRPEMYDVREDPGELDNLAADVQYSDQLNRLAARLITWMEQISDPLLNDWTRRHVTECLP
jgi:arylsulfatase A-like enzyme